MRFGKEEAARAVTPPPCPVLTQIRADPAQTMGLAGMKPDPWQARALRSVAKRMLFLCSRQAGKSQTASALSLAEALTRPRALVLILSPTQRQSGELFRQKLLPLWHGLGMPLKARSPSATELVLSNGSRVVSLPENEEGIRGFSAVTLLVIDEASRVDDLLYRAVRPMLSTSGGRLLALSTPYGRRGWFFEEWEGGQGWERYRVRADQCPRIPAAFLAEERVALGERWYRQEYECDFADAIDAVFSQSVINQADNGNDIQPLW